MGQLVPLKPILASELGWTWSQQVAAGKAGRGQVKAGHCEEAAGCLSWLGWLPQRVSLGSSRRC